MTLQVALRCFDDSIVLASDTKIILPGSGLERPDRTEQGSKVHVEREAWGSGIAVATAGIYIDVDKPSPGAVLARYLASEFTSPPDDLGAQLSEWGSRFFRDAKYDPSEWPPHQGPCNLLLVTPTSLGDRLWLLRVNSTSTSNSFPKRAINGHEANIAPAFWLEYMQTDRETISLAEGTSIAAASVLLGGGRVNSSVGGLEIHQYTKANGWKSWSDDENRAVIASFERNEESLKTLILGLAQPSPASDTSAS